MASSVFTIRHAVIESMMVQFLIALVLCEGNLSSVTGHRCSSLSCKLWDDTKIYPDKLFSVYVVPSTPCCDSCSCDNNKCHVYGDYCNETNTSSGNFVQISTVVLTCVKLQLRPTRNSYPKQNYNIFTNKMCPLSYHRMSNSDSRLYMTTEKCENADSYNELEARVPVSDKRTGLTYINMFCGRCNHVPDDVMVFWNPKIHCLNESYWPSNYSAIVTDIQMTRGCNILFEKPADVSIITPSCEIQRTPNCMIDIRADCFSNSTDNHVVCYLAPNEIVNSAVRCTRIIEVDMPLMLSYSLLFRFNPTETILARHPAYGITCSPNTFHDQLKNQCRNLTCAPQRILEAGTCQNNVQTISGAIIDIFVKLSPKNITSVDVPIIGNSIMNYGKQYLANASIESYNCRLFVTSNNSSSDLYYVFHVTVKVANDIEVSVKWFDTLLQLGHISFPLAGNNVGTEIINLHAIRGKPEEMINAFDGGILTLYDIFRANESEVASFTPTITLLSTSSCPLITLDVEELDIQKFTWGIRIPELNANISNWNIIRHAIVVGQLTSIKICSGMYKDLIQPYVAKSVVFSNSTFNETRQILVRSFSAVAVGFLSLFCTCVSVLCALLTVLTYSLFKDLRTQPGINNIALCINLVIAQMMFQFGIGQTDNIPEWACVTIGIHIHFFWMSTVMWMNVCCIHSYEVFRTLNKHRDHRVSARRMGFYILYATTFASFPVIVNIVTHILKDDGNTGYGRTVCYLANNTIISLTFALPVGFILCINLILFVIIILIQQCKPALHLNPTREKQRQCLGIYVRLSTLTGCLWMFGFIYMFTDEVWLEYIFIVLNASQGVFIFASFVCNKTCARKYLKLLNEHSTLETKTTRVSNITTRRT